VIDQGGRTRQSNRFIRDYLREVGTCGPAGGKARDDGSCNARCNGEEVSSVGIFACP
jgi:hypothetical protein